MKLNIIDIIAGLILLTLLVSGLLFIDHSNFEGNSGNGYSIGISINGIILICIGIMCIPVYIYYRIRTKKIIKEIDK